MAKLVLDNLIQAAAGVVVAVTIPLAAKFPDAAPYLAIGAGAVTFVMGKMYPDWNQGMFKP